MSARRFAQHCPPRPARQRGAAILLAMLTVTLVAAFAVAALWQQWRSVQVETAERARVQSSWILTGALDWGRLILQEDRNASTTDHLAEPWAVPLEEARLSTFLAAKDGVADADASTGDDALQAFLSGRITDLQSHMNVYNLVASTADPADAVLARKQFAKLFDLLGLPQAELAALAENMRFASDESADNRSAGQAPLLPRRMAHLTWFGLSPATVAALEPFVAVLPPTRIGVVPGTLTKINVNTAPEEVLYAAIDGLDKTGAKKLVAVREQGFFDRLEKVEQTLDGLAGKVPGKSFDVASYVFEVIGQLRLDQNVVQERSVVLRTQQRRVVVLWRERTALNLAAAPVSSAPQR